MTMELLPALTGHRILLASSSPRRRELLTMLDIPFEVVKAPDCKETWPEGMKPEEVPAYLSQLKADACRSEMGDNELWITADTVVIVDGEVLGKPRNAADAKQMLHMLSGKSHHVVTGVTLTSTRHSHTFSCTTRVDFAAIPDDEISVYVDNYHPMDKAGSYGIQEWIGAVGICSIDGSFYNVMGLPVHRLWQAMKAWPL